MTNVSAHCSQTKDSSEGQVLIDVDDFVGGGTETHRHGQFLGSNCSFRKGASHVLKLDKKPLVLHVYHRFLKDVDQFGHGLTWTPLEFLTKAILHWSLPRGLFHAHGSLELRSFPHECLCLYPLSDEFDWARWSQGIFLLSLSDGTAVELREKSLRQASPFRDEVVPRWHSIPCVLVFTHVRCADCAGAATSCCTLPDAAVTIRVTNVCAHRSQTKDSSQTLRPSEAWFTEPCRAYFSRGKQTTFNFRITLKRNVLNSNNRGTTRKISVVIVPRLFQLSR